jgi:hypothetical protein
MRLGGPMIPYFFTTSLRIRVVSGIQETLGVETTFNNINEDWYKKLEGLVHEPGRLSIWRGVPHSELYNGFMIRIKL